MSQTHLLRCHRGEEHREVLYDRKSKPNPKYQVSKEAANRYEHAM